MVQQEDKHINALALFMDRWEAANAKLNEGLHYPIYELHPSRLRELVKDFTEKEKHFVQSSLNDSIPNIGHISII